MVDRVFQWCVDLLNWLAGMTGTTYKEINVIIFCVVWPLLTIALVAICLVQCVRIIRLQKQMGGGSESCARVEKDR